MYKKEMLVRLCKAYGVSTNARDNKNKLAKELVVKVVDQSNSSIPQPWHLYTPTGSETNLVGQHVVLRITF